MKGLSDGKKATAERLTHTDEPFSCSQAVAKPQSLLHGRIFVSGVMPKESELVCSSGVIKRDLHAVNKIIETRQDIGALPERICWVFK